ncbi:MAG TPA: flavodoxin-dependent (E)-4-hydroxy-3-methylbut-2-enyl-diphosphate synthase [Bacillota bacterium]|nr:flavodoxin-dependent (E)-4-hydroxy-3-methylbut-2-enyl-diphosphate synthase [Clostridiales bacterium]HPT84815.1 flavodoxin-dependent (E)-4-hydroxy-3-methylbut-2-enyl-diphosphate synthase [Bacillota bacterium]
MIKRRNSKPVRVGSVTVGGGAPISVQSMTNTRTSEIETTLAQLRELEKAGCDIVRVSVTDEESARAIYRFKLSGIKMPIVADIHFSARLAVLAADAGADKIRINPGNIGGDEKIKLVTDACKKRGIPIRIGVNSGSLEKHILARYGRPTPEALAESALYHISLLEKFDFYDIIVAIKSSSVADTVMANRIVAERCDYPLHLGVTEAGTDARGTIKSAIGIGALLCDGIGDTIRVSLTADPVLEVRRGREILAALGLNSAGIDVISCPTCARTGFDLIATVERLERAIEEKYKGKALSRRYTVAVMGCAVNGPGEAREADFGVAGGRGEALLFRSGVPVRKIAEEDIIPVLLDEIDAAEKAAQECISCKE